MSNSNTERPKVEVIELFIWRWAANLCRGDVTSILTSLHEGLPHPAIDWRIEPLVPEKLEIALAEIRKNNPGMLTCVRELRHDGSMFALRVSLVAAGNMFPAIKALSKAVDTMRLTGSAAYKPRLLPECYPKTFSLKLDEERVASLPLYDPSSDEVVEALGRVDVRRGICYAILESTKGGYVQTYGCDGKFYVETRSFHDRAWRKYNHYVAGKRPRSTKLAWLGDNRHSVSAFKHELLDRTDVERIFRAFYNGGARIRDYTWRDITDCFKALAGQTEQPEEGKP